MLTLMASGELHYYKTMSGVTAALCVCRSLELLGIAFKFTFTVPKQVSIFKSYVAQVWQSTLKA